MTFPDPNITRPYEMVTYVNTVTDNYFGPVVLLIIFIVAFMALKNYKTSTTFATSIFITTLFALLFRAAGWVGDPVVIGMILASVAGIAFLWFDKSQ